MKDLDYGVHYNISNDEYHSDKRFLSSSGLKKLLYEPELFYRTVIKNEGKKESKDAFDVGTALHTKVLEPHLYDQTIAFYSKIKRGKDWDAFSAANPGKIILSDLAKLQIDRMYDSVMKTLGRDYVTGGQSEVTILTNIDGIDIKIKIDHLLLMLGIMADLKSTEGLVTERSFLRKAESQMLSYDLSAALYFDVANLVLENAIKDFYFVVASKDFDDSKVFRCTPEFLEQGRKKYKESIRLYKHYQATNWDFKQTVIDLKPSSYDLVGGF